MIALPDLVSLLQNGVANLWLFIPTAIALGALHGLEPGHSKTMMAAFIVAIRGTVLQAVLLGLAATVSHTAIVWAIALAGLYFGARWNTEATEPYLQLVSAVLIIGIALWMLWRTRKAQSHDHHHDMGPHTIDTGDGSIAIDVFEDGVPPRWRIERLSGPTLSPACLSLQTMRPDGSSQTFTFAEVDGLLESEQEIPEPHEFTATVRLAYDNHAHDYTLQFHEHDHSDELSGLDVGAGNAVDAHQREHADDIRKRFANRNVTTGQIVLFGLTGGLIPCPASLTILLLCLQLKQFTLGATLVLCFSIGLAITMVGVGAAAALSVHHVATRWSAFNAIAQRAPYLSGGLIICVGLYTGYLGWEALLPRG